MNDPYIVLGVSRTASDEEIKKAYRELARKYHPDNYHDNPLADLAQEKMKDINEAYDTITKERSGSRSGASYSGQSYSGQSSYSRSDSSDPGRADLLRARVAINQGNTELAEQILARCQNRDAEWNYLMGRVYNMKGWYSDAKMYMQRAVSMDPSNYEYQKELDRMVNRDVYRPNGYGMPAENDLCDICGALMCANMFCRCMT